MVVVSPADKLSEAFVNGVCHGRMVITPSSSWAYNVRVRRKGAKGANKQLAGDLQLP